MHTIIIGCGVSGLSCGIRLQEAGHSVQIWARELPPDTTSNVAAAVWYPYKAYPEQLVLGWAAASFGVFVRLAGEPGCGVTMREGVELFTQPVDDPWWRAAVVSFRRAARAELPPGYADGYVFATPVIEMDRYLAYLRARFESGGGTVNVRTLRDVREAFSAAEVVVNCAGLGARELVGDPSVYAIRGQVVRVSGVAGVAQVVMDEHSAQGLAYIVPRSDDCILGGVAEQGRELRDAEPATAAAIIARCVALEPRLAGATVLEHRVGLRPGRATVRLEAQRTGGGLLIHNYGHGGAGVTLSWGCADAVARLATHGA